MSGTVVFHASHFTNLALLTFKSDFVLALQRHKYQLAEALYEYSEGKLKTDGVDALFEAVREKPASLIFCEHATLSATIAHTASGLGACPNLRRSPILVYDLAGTVADLFLNAHPDLDIVARTRATGDFTQLQEVKLWHGVFDAVHESETTGADLRQCLQDMHRKQGMEILAGTLVINPRSSAGRPAQPKRSFLGTPLKPS